MSFFGLTANAPSTWAVSPSTPPKAMELAESILFGAIYFGFASVVVFGVWAFFGRALSAFLSEAGFYAVCAIVYIALAGILLRQLVIFKPRLARFYLFFASSFGLYAVIWSLCWILLRGRAGELLGSLLGTAGMAVLFWQAFEARNALLRVALALFIGNACGYFLGGYLYEAAQHGPLSEALSGMLNKSGRATAAKFLWGITFGMGFGAGLGYAFYACQSKSRLLLQNHVAAQ